MRELFERASHALGMDESFLGRLQRPLRAAVRNGCLARFQNRLSDEPRCVEADGTARERTLQHFNPLTLQRLPCPITTLSSTMF